MRLRMEGAAGMKAGLRKAASLLSGSLQVSSDLLDEDRVEREYGIRKKLFFMSCCIQCGFSLCKLKH